MYKKTKQEWTNEVIFKLLDFLISRPVGVVGVENFNLTVDGVEQVLVEFMVKHREDVRDAVERIERQSLDDVFSVVNARKTVAEIRKN